MVAASRILPKAKSGHTQQRQKDVMFGKPTPYGSHNQILHPAYKQHYEIYTDNSALFRLHTRGCL